MFTSGPALSEPIIAVSRFGRTVEARQPHMAAPYAPRHWPSLCFFLFVLGEAVEPGTHFGFRLVHVVP
jgi:hypothetical protein